MIERDFIIIGAGAAGLAAGAAAAAEGCKTLLLDSSEGAGRKLLLTGGGRCNLSNLRLNPLRDDPFYGNGRFLLPALAAFSPRDLISLCQTHALELMEEDGGRLFPADGKAQSVLDFWLRLTKGSGTAFRFRETVLDLEASDGFWYLNGRKERYRAKALLVATGGASFPQTGSNGAFLSCLSALGLRVHPFEAALAPLTLRESPAESLSGISLKDVELSLCESRSRHTAFRGDLLLSGRTLSGPVALKLSRQLPPAANPPVRLRLNLLPDAKSEELDNTLALLLAENPLKQIKNLPLSALPAALRAPWLQKLGLSPDDRANTISKKERRQIVHGLLDFPLHCCAKAPLEQAIVSRGGVDLAEINPRSMEARRFPALFLAGEVLNLDGETGGYNLQAAFSTGWLAGREASRLIRERRDSQAKERENRAEL